MVSAPGAEIVSMRGSDGSEYGFLYLIWAPSLLLLHWDAVGKRHIAGRLWRAAAVFGVRNNVRRMRRLLGSP